RQYRLELWNVFFDEVHHRQCRGIRTLGDRDIDSPLAIDQREPGLNIRAVFDRAQVAEKDRSRAVGSDRDRAQVLQIGDDGVDRHHRHLIADADVAGWADDVSLENRLDDLVRGHVICTQALWIGADD